MRAGCAVLVLVVSACGRYGFADGPADAPTTPDAMSDAMSDAMPDPTPDPIDWADFTDVSAAQVITGINEPIDLDVMASYATGTPLIELRSNGGAWMSVSPAAPASVSASPDDTLQFRVSGIIGQSAFLTVTNASTAGTLLDTILGTAASPVTGSGTTSAPYVAPGTPPVSCLAFLAAYPEQAGLDGVYAISPAAPLDAYCDMTSDSAGWTLVAEVEATSTTHVTAAGVGILTDPGQFTTAKLADAVINSIPFASARIKIENVGTIYTVVTSLNLSGTDFSAPNSAAASLAGPYTFNFATFTVCSSDCGVAIVNANISIGNRCGYRYYTSTGNPRPGMGCQGNFGKGGTVWVR